MNDKPDDNAQKSIKAPIAATLEAVLFAAALTGTAAVVEFLRGKPVVRAVLVTFITAIATQAIIMLWPIVRKRISQPRRSPN